MQINVKKTLDMAGLSQYRFAKELGTHNQHVSRWYLGINKPSKLWTEKLIEYFNANDITIYE